MRKCLKSRKHTFKNLHNLVQSLTDKPINDKLLVFSDKIVFVWISSQKPSVCQKPGGSPCGRLMPDPRDWQCVQMPRSCPGGWAQLELSDALPANIRHYSFSQINTAFFIGTLRVFHSLISFKREFTRQMIRYWFPIHKVFHSQCKIRSISPRLGDMLLVRFIATDSGADYMTNFSPGWNFSPPPGLKFCCHYMTTVCGPVSGQVTLR